MVASVYVRSAWKRGRAVVLLALGKQRRGANQKAKVREGLETGNWFPFRPSLKLQASRGVEQEAEGYFLKATDIARCQQAKSMELQAVMSLSRLWRQRGKQKEAHAMLSTVHGWFTEGFETKDLQEAKALLEALARTSLTQV